MVNWWRPGLSSMAEGSLATPHGVVQKPTRTTSSVSTTKLDLSTLFSKTNPSGCNRSLVFALLGGTLRRAIGRLVLDDLVGGGTCVCHRPQAFG